MKRRQERERDEATAHEQAERRREKLLAEVKAREAARRERPDQPVADPDDQGEHPEDPPTAADHLDARPP